MHTDASPPREDPATDTGAPTIGVELDNGTTHEPRRQPIIAFFTRRAFLSKDTGRWHKLSGGRDRHGDERPDAHDMDGGR
jgi:hypothetical protein